MISYGIIRLKKKKILSFKMYNQHGYRKVVKISLIKKKRGSLTCAGERSKNGEKKKKMVRISENDGPYRECI